MKSVTENGPFYEVAFNTIPNLLYWPRNTSPAGIYQVTTETFDPEDWHYYQKEHTVVEPDEMLLDIGAAEGLFALSVIDRCSKVYLIEPNDYFVASLRKTFEFCPDKIKIFNVAIGSEEGEISFNQDSLSGKITTGQQAAKKKLTRIDTLLAQSRITYLKADLEGYELEMLKGAEATIKRNKPKIAITTYHPENNAGEIIELVKKFVPEYKHWTKGIIHTGGKPVMIHFWI